MTDKTALVTGATGFLGRNLVAELLKQEWSVLVMCRRPMSSSFDPSPNLTVVQGDLFNKKSIEQAVPDGLNCLFHLASDTGFWRPNNERQRAANVEGTRYVMAAAKARGVKRVIHTSTVGVYGEEFRNIDESAPHAGEHSWINYLKTKADAEKLVQHEVSEGLPAIILNPCNIVGPHDTRNWSRLFRMINDESLPGVPPGSGVFCDARAVAAAHIAAYEQGRIGENYILGGVHASYLELIQIASRLLDRKIPDKTTPAVVLKTLGRLSLWASYLTRREPDLTPEGAAIVCGYSSIDTEKAHNAFGYASPPLEIMVGDTLTWMRQTQLLESRQR